MSHWTTVKTQIKDMAALDAACAELGLKLVHKGTARGYYKSETAPWVIKVPQAKYDIKVNLDAQGNASLTTDWYGGSVASAVGEGFSKINQLYAVHKVSMEAVSAGNIVTRMEGVDGSINLEISNSMEGA